MSADPLFPHPVVLLLAGSSSDLEKVLDCESVLVKLGLPAEIRVLSAHRTPDETVECVKAAEERGFRAIICFAGLSAHLAGVAAAHTLLPVIGVPLSAGPLRGVDAALATLQLPPGTPVATVAIDNTRNAALLAGRILGLVSPAVRTRLGEVVDADRARYEPEKIAAEIEKRRAARRKPRDG